MQGGEICPRVLGGRSTCECRRERSARECWGRQIERWGDLFPLLGGRSAASVREGRIERITPASVGGHRSPRVHECSGKEICPRVLGSTASVREERSASRSDSKTVQDSILTPSSALPRWPRTSRKPTVRYQSATRSLIRTSRRFGAPRDVL